MRSPAPTASSRRFPAVTDGLSPGGLVVDPRVGGTPNLWINADQPTSSTDINGQTSVVIKQTAQNAIMTWQQFNVGRNTTLTYDQKGNANWVALNRVDATGVPSQILGRIKADGTVLIINPNGIIFGGSSQVDVHTLIATSLDINSGKTASVFFNNGSSAYSPTYVAQGANGVSFFVPVNEDGANQSFVQNGLYPLAGSKATSFSAVFSLGNQTLGSLGGGAIEVQPGASIATNAHRDRRWRLCGAARSQSDQCRRHHHPERADHSGRGQYDHPERARLLRDRRSDRADSHPGRARDHQQHFGHDLHQSWHQYFLRHHYRIHGQ